MFREDGYINMTKAAKHFEKDLKEFFKNKGTKEYMAAMEAMGGIPPNALKQATRGGSVQGTYGHPKLAVFFARWLDVRFAVWCDLMIDNILKGNIQTTVVVPVKEAIDVESVVAPLKARILGLEEESANTIMNQILSTIV